ncbi:MAG: pyruvate dehydrogenase (acetyl-transferring) E1 component subunit alpha, partial [Nitrospirae bacterium]|nr:pyruvate dehydrogenase (acetyl-transferring) E1 component subunit alpha [Nitrospirota bacterium]
NFLGGHAIVGGHIPIATGVGFSVKYRQQQRVVLCSFGEGAVNAGAFHESLNLAALWRLPVIYLCENNLYEMGIHYEMTSAVKELTRRAEAYGVAHAMVDGTDVVAVREAVTIAAQRAREESLPTFIEARTYRFVGHSMADPAHGFYRSREELEKQRGFDPIARFLPVLREAGVEESQWSAVESEVQRVVEESVAFAEASPEPAMETLYDDLYA